MSTTTAPTFQLTDRIGPNFSADKRPNPNTIALIKRQRDEDWAAVLVVAPYVDPRMADIVRFAVVLTDNRGDIHLLGRVIQCGPQTWEAFNSDASHSFGNFRTADMAARYIEMEVEW